MRLVLSLLSLVILVAPAQAETCRGLTATIVGTNGNDQLRGTPGDDVIAGLGGNDVIRGEGGNDVLCGGPGNDTIFGGAGNDELDGGEGNNSLHGDDGSDECVNGKPHQCEENGGRPPVANAGPDQSVIAGALVTLDGSRSNNTGSSDALTFHWSFVSAPAGATPVLSDAAAIQPTFIATIPGSYVAQLIVRAAGQESAPDTVVITAGEAPNSAPVANAGPDRSTTVGGVATLDGSGSFDADGDLLTFHWAFVMLPEGSGAVLSDARAVMPSFTVDVAGTYEITLRVNDGTADSALDSVSVVTTNSRPVANAGADATSRVGETVTLDGTLSTDADRDALTYRWTVINAPGGSTATPPDPSAPRPTLHIDRAGAYLIQLVVNDGALDSEPDTVLISTTNSAPVANAGLDATVRVGDRVTLDGAGSSDVDGDTLTYRWAFTSRPDGSMAALPDSTAIRPSFTVDRFGTYVVQLIVNDGTADSEADTVSIVTTNSAPVANAGADATAFVTEVVTLDGSGSSDADGDPLTYLWSLTTLPAGSTVALSDPAAVAPSFTVDLPGTYVAQLIVNDGAIDSAEDTVTINTVNSAPVARAGDDGLTFVRTVVTLDGSGSSDVDRDPLSYRWSLLTIPDGSTATLTGATTDRPTFFADRHGTYVAQLIVNDGTVDSAPDTVTIITNPPNISLVLVGTPLIGVGRSAQLQVVLPDPAPAGGVTVTVTSDAPGIASINAPGTVFIAEGATTGMVTATGVAPGSALVRANAPDYGEGSATITVTDKLVNLPDAFSVPLGQQASLLVSIAPHPAPAGGTIIQLTTSDENVIAVSASVTILPGQFSATATVAGVRPGTAIVTATNPDFATDASSVSTAAQLNITETSRTFTAGFTAAPFTIRLESGGAPANAPSPGIAVTVTSSNPSCATGTSVNIGTGLQTASSAVTWGGTTTLPCTATLTASSPGVTSDTILVTVNQKPNITLELSSNFPQIVGFPATVGSGLVSTNLRAFLGVAAHGGATVRVESSDPTRVLVSPNAATAGTPFIDVTLPNNQNTVNFVVHGLENVTGTSTITVSEPRFNSASNTATVVQPVIKFSGLLAAMETLSPNRNFTVTVGTPALLQNVRPTGAGFNVTVTSSDPAIGDLSFGAASGGSITAPIGPGAFQTANILFRPRTVGTTSISAAAPSTLPPANFAVTLTKPSITLELSSTFPQVVGFPATVGAGLHTSTLRALLSSGNHGGATIHIESSDPTRVLVSPNAATVGTASIDITIPNNTTAVNFVVHGVESVTGPSTITASESRYNSGSNIATVVQPVLRFNGLTSPINTLAPNRNFTLLIGAGLLNQTVRPGGTGFEVTVNSSEPSFGDLLFGATSGASITATLGPGATQTGTIFFRPKTAGTTVISASAPGTISPANFSITVTTPTITLEPNSSLINGFPATVGAGLQTGNVRALLSAGNHGGATFHIESSDPARVLISATATSTAAASIDVTIPNNSTAVNFVLHGLENVTGPSTITVTESRFAPTSGTATVVQPTIRFNGLATGNIDSLDPNDSFNFTIAAGTINQTVRTGGVAVPVTITSSTPAVGDLIVGAAPPSASVMVSFAPGASLSTNAAFRPRSAGSTIISASAPGVISPPNVTMTVTTPVISMTDSPGTIGSGLQGVNTRATLGASNHGGATVRVSSSNPAIALVSPNATTPGSEFFEVTLPNGTTQVNYFVQGVENASGGVVITVSSNRYADGNINAVIVPAHIRIAGLPATKAAGSADTPFSVQVGIPTADGSNVASQQNVRAGGTPIAVTLTSTNTAAGTLVSGGVAGATATVTIPTLTSTIGGVSFRAVAAGSTTVTATATNPPGVVTSGAGNVSVNVN